MSDGAPSYEILTVADFAKVPPKRLRACLREFALAVESARALERLLRRTQEVLQEGDSMAPGELVQWPMNSFTWTDDKEKTMTVHVCVADQAAVAVPPPETPA